MKGRKKEREKERARKQNWKKIIKGRKKERNKEWKKEQLHLEISLTRSISGLNKCH
jgi:hypothetical protein